MDDGIPVQQVEYSQLSERLIADGQVLTIGNMDLPSPINSITSSEGAPADTADPAGTLQTITIGSTTYDNLTAPDTLSSSDSVDYVAIGTVPGTIEGALGGLNLDTGSLNYNFIAQFDRTIQDTDLFFVLNNTTDDIFNSFTIQAIDSGGAEVGSSKSFGNYGSMPELVTGRTWDRTGGSTLENRAMHGQAFSLADLGLDGNTTVTGFTLTTTSLDPAVVGLATAAPTLGDADNDGMDDAWEVEHFGNTDRDGSGDLNDNGVPDFFEYLYGSDPSHNAGLGFKLQANATGGAVVIDWAVQEAFVLDSDYLLQYANDLGDSGTWQTLPATDYTLNPKTSNGMTSMEVRLTVDHGSPVFIRLAQP